MSIEIYTYSDPYRLPEEAYWNDIKSCPYFCASQTLVNGLRVLYKKEFQNGRVTTMQNLIKELYPGWESTGAAVKQHALLDQIMTQGIGQTLAPEMQNNLLAAFIFNREEVFRSIRILFELNLNPAEILTDKLSPEQKLIVKVYQTIIDSSAKKDFTIDEPSSEEQVDIALNNAMKVNNPDCNQDMIPKDRIVIHGIHQFTPIMLRGIELLSKYKKVILLFNYQSQYAAAYQTWIDIYGAFDLPFGSSKVSEFHPSIEYKYSYQCNTIADSLGRMINGNLQEIKQQDGCEILEFDNVTEFASYVATLFEEAARTERINPLDAMSEQIYAADSSVNNILKMYFPEQFGERQFLNYPLGHFFIAIANMWDSQDNSVLIRDMNDVRECLSAGILPEDTPGELASIYGKTSALFEGCTDIREMVSRLHRARRLRKGLTEPDEMECIEHISYYDADIREIEKLEKALGELNDLANYFYEDFENTAHNFRKFYKKLRAYIQDQSIDADKLGEEYVDILRRVLERLQEVEDIDATASFECLKATMSIYLVQEAKPGKRADWIVRDFEQIDGDILRSFTHPDDTIYHFACLSDEDINSVKQSEYSWPLDADFFEVAQEPVDWKYQVYVKCRKEYKNFKRYALLYGLEFNRSKFKLSYVKHDGNNDQTVYAILKILGFKITPYKLYRRDHHVPDVSGIHINSDSVGTFSEFDYYRYRICPYRFLVESLVENNTVYKDPFLLGKYLEVWLENSVKTELAGTPISEVILINKLNEAFDDIKRYFPFVQNVNRMDMINTIRNRITGSKSKMIPRLTQDELRQMKIRELFIHQVLSDPRTHRNNVLADRFAPVSEETVNEKLSNENLQGSVYRPEADIWCQYCSNRESCVACYALDSFKEA